MFYKYNAKQKRYDNLYRSIKSKEELSARDRGDVVELAKAKGSETPRLCFCDFHISGSNW